MYVQYCTYHHIILGLYIIYIFPLKIFCALPCPALPMYNADAAQHNPIQCMYIQNKSNQITKKEKKAASGGICFIFCLLASYASAR